MGNQSELPRLKHLLKDNPEIIERLLHLLETGTVRSDGSYPTWPQLSLQPPAAYLTLRDWWLALKLQRLLGRQEIGLKASGGQPITVGSVESFAEAIHGMDRTGRSGNDDGDAGSRRVREYLAVEALREEAIASAQLDGAGIALEVARGFLGSGRKARDPDEQKVFNTHRTLERIREIRAQPLTLALLADLHQRLTAGTVVKGDFSGRLRREDDVVSAESVDEKLEREPPPAAELPVRLKAMLAFANGRAPGHFVHPLLRAAALHFWVLHDQPFAEGSGRLARALYYWCVLHAGYAEFEILAPSAALRDAPAAYRRAFNEVLADDHDLMYFAAHLFEAMAKAQRRCKGEAACWWEELQGTENLPGVAEFNDRQRLLIARARREPSLRRTLQEHARDHNLARQTARNDFAPLVKLGWFEETKVSRALTFFPAPDLAERIKGT